MFCEHCGKPVSDDALFCENCGARLQPEEAEPNAQPAPDTQSVPIAEPAPQPKVSLGDKLKTLCQQKKWLLPTVAVALTVIIVVAVIAGMLGKQVKICDYLHVEVSGYNGFGYVDYDIDLGSLSLRCMGERQYKGYKDWNEADEADIKEIRDWLKDLQKKNADQFKLTDQFIDSIEISEELPEGKSRQSLSNGDVIRYTIECDESLAKKLGITIKGEQFEYTVKDLPEAAIYNLLENFELHFTGYDGFGHAEVVCKETGSVTAGDITFQTEVGSADIRYTVKDGRSSRIQLHFDRENDRFKNGDVVALCADVTEEAFASNGVMLTNLRAEYTVAGLAKTQEADLMAHLQVVFEGVDGSGKAQVLDEVEPFTLGGLHFDLANGKITKGDEYVSGFRCSLSKTRSLTNGDKITLSIRVDTDALAQCGVTVRSTEQEITVSGLAHYVENLAEVQDHLGELVETGKAMVSDYLNEDWSGAVHDSWKTYSNQKIGDDLKLYKIVVTTPKSSTSSMKNTIWLIYSVTLSDNTMEPTVYYFALSEKNLAINEAGELTHTVSSMTRYHGEDSYEKLKEDRIQAYNLNIFESTD